MNDTTKVIPHPLTLISDMESELLSVLPTGLAVYMSSDPGIGKTHVVRAVARKLHAVVITLVASLLERFDLSGLPYTDTKGAVSVTTPGGLTEQIPLTRFAPNDLILKLSKEGNPQGGPVILYLNELNAAPPSTYAVFHRLINDGERSINEFTLRDNVYVVGDGNPTSSRSVGHELPESIKRRLIMYSVKTDVPAWLAWAQENGIDGRIMSFFSTEGFGRHLNDFDPLRSRERMTYASPASWEKASTLLRTLTSNDLSAALRRVSGAVGPEAATAFTGYMAHADDIPNIGSILESPETAVLPDRADLLSLLCGMTINHVTERPTTLKPALLLVKRMLASSRPWESEFSVFLLRSLARRPALRSSISRQTSTMATLVEIVSARSELKTLLTSEAFAEAA